MQILVFSLVSFPYYGVQEQYKRSFAVKIFTNTCVLRNKQLKKSSAVSKLYSSLIQNLSVK